MGTAPLIPLIAKFAIPSIISMLVGAAYNVTDQIFIGHVVGMLGNAATNVAFPTVTLTTGISMLFGMGTASNFSINQGAGRIEEARKYVHTGLTGVMIAGILVGLLVYFFRSPIIVLCGADPAGNVYPYAMAYLSITAFGLPFQMFAHTSSMIIRADGKPGHQRRRICYGAGPDAELHSGCAVLSEIQSLPSEHKRAGHQRATSAEQHGSRHPELL